MSSAEARLFLENTEYKNTQKMTWLAETKKGPPFTPTVCVHFDNIITKGILKPEDDFKNYVNWNSKVMLVTHTVVSITFSEGGSDES